MPDELLDKVYELFPGSSGTLAMSDGMERRENAMSRGSACSHARRGEAGQLLAKYRMVVVLMILVAMTAAGQQERRLVSNPQPEYPEIARKMNLSGVVKIEVVIGSDGAIKNAKVVGGHPVLADASLKALKNWKFAPSGSESKELLEFKF